MLAPNGKTVSDLSGGLAAVVESYLVRNAVAHAQTMWTTKMSTRVQAAGGEAHRRGERVDLSDVAAAGHRRAISGLMNSSGLKARTRP